MEIAARCLHSQFGHREMEAKQCLLNRNSKMSKQARDTQPASGKMKQKRVAMRQQQMELI